MRKSTTTVNNQSIIEIEITLGELVDRITILEVKRENIKDEEKLSHVKRELEALSFTLGSILFYDGTRMVHVEVPDELRNKLHDVNADLWDVQEVQRKIAHDETNQKFIDCSLWIFRLNDMRFELKGTISALINSNTPAEQKEYV